MTVLLDADFEGGLLYANAQAAFSTCRPSFQLSLTHFPQGAQGLRGVIVLTADTAGQATDMAWDKFQKTARLAGFKYKELVTLEVRSHPYDPSNSIFWH